MSLVPLICVGLARPREASAMTKKPHAAINIPKPIFFGVDGSLPFFASAPKSATEMGVSSTTKKGLNCWKSCGSMCVLG